MEPSLASGIRSSSSGLASGTLFLFPNGDRAKTSPPIDKFGGASSAPAAAARIAPREFAFLLAAVLVGGDLIVAGLSIFAGLQLRELQRLGWMVASLQLNLGSPQIGWSVGGAILFVWLMAVFKTYDADNLYRVQRWLKNVLKAVFIWSVLIWACIGVFRVTDFSPRIGVVYCMIGLVGFTVAWRLMSFTLLIQPRVKEAASSRVIVVGWSEKAAHLRQAMRGDLAQLQEIIGCVPLPGGVFATPPPAEVAVLGDCASLPQLVHKCQADAIILADVSCAASEIQHLVTFCQREMLHFQMVPEYFPALSSGLQVQTMSGVPLLSVRQLPLDRTINRFLKRLMDIFGALVGLAISAMIVPPFMLLVYLESPGPVIYRQLRTSRSGRTFHIYKIRSMRLNAEASSGAVWCKQEDSRRLKIGTFMRKTNIDELPQFWNVLIGDMSLVGPRPERPELIERFKDEIPNYNARHEVRTAITGWAQIHGLRGDTDLTKRIEADLYYLENWSPLLDLYCIVATFFKIKNAH
jgi:exopolysaccharide biosynthesis polyprenyl glycosylphosphotransferase